MEKKVTDLLQWMIQITLCIIPVSTYQKEGSILIRTIQLSLNQARMTNVTPVLTLDMIRKALKKEGLYVKTLQNVYGNEVYHVVDENNVIQSPEQGMYFNELAKYAELVS